ncbi:MAG: hypothetical protein P1V20_05340 [Verrucomicrobiales bacterium]|nr:hypothetical protein [Verrucomicrobiales bacterium]
MKKATLALLNLFAGLILVRFTVSKFAAWPISVAAFEDMAKPLGLDPTFFRIFTGFIIGFAAISFFTNGLIFLFSKIDSRKIVRLFAATNLYAIGAMSGALLSEFFLRSEPKWMLVYIAAGILCVTAINLSLYHKKILNTFFEGHPVDSLQPSKG